MICRTTLVGATAVLALAMSVTAAAKEPATADKWQPVARTDTQEAFVNAGSITSVGGHIEARAKINYVQPQPAAKQGKSFLSARSTYRFDCAQRRIAMKEIRAYEGADLQGAQVQKATSSDKNLQWLDAPERTVFGELLDYVCSKSPGG